MTRLVWAVAWVMVAIWSLFAWGAYGVVSLFGGLAARNADALSSDPATVEWLFWTFSALKSLGLTTITIVWGLVSLAILAVPWLLGRLAPPPQPRPGPDTQIIYPPRPDQPVIEMPRNEPPGRRDLARRS